MQEGYGISGKYTKKLISRIVRKSDLFLVLFLFFVFALYSLSPKFIFKNNVHDFRYTRTFKLFENQEILIVCLFWTYFIDIIKRNNLLVPLLEVIQYVMRNK